MLTAIQERLRANVETAEASTSSETSAASDKLLSDDVAEPAASGQSAETSEPTVADEPAVASTVAEEPTVADEPTMASEPTTDEPTWQTPEPGLISSPKAPPQVGDDRRAHERKWLRVQVNLSLTDGRVMNGRSVNVSTAGMAVVVGANLRGPMEMSLRFALPYRDGTRHVGEVTAALAYCVYTSDHGGFLIGLQFRNPDGPLSEALQRYLTDV